MSNAINFFIFSCEQKENIAIFFSSCGTKFIIFFSIKSLDSSDVVIESEDGKLFHCHKCLLTLRSGSLFTCVFALCYEKTVE